MSREELILMVNNSLSNGALKEFHQFFIIQRDTEYLKLNDEILKKIAPVTSNLVANAILQKLSEFTNSKLVARKKPSPRGRGGSGSIPLVVCDLSLQELANIESQFMYS
jgi:hypothetical protein